MSIPTLDMYKWLQGMYRQASDGGNMQKKNEGGWCNMSTGSIGPNLRSNPNDWRIEPIKTRIDLTPLIGSQIDCMFPFGSIDRLLKINSHKHTPYWTSETQSHSECFPRMHPFINHWQGSTDCPIPEGFDVILYLRNDRRLYDVGDVLTWECAGLPTDVIGISFTGVKDVYTLDRHSV